MISLTVGVLVIFSTFVNSQDADFQVKYLKPHQGQGHNLYYNDGEAIRHEMWRYNEKTGEPSVQIRHGYVENDKIYLTDTSRTPEGSSVQTHVLQKDALRRFINSLNAEEPKEPQARSLELSVVEPINRQWLSPQNFWNFALGLGSNFFNRPEGNLQQVPGINFTSGLVSFLSNGLSQFIPPTNTDEIVTDAIIEPTSPEVQQGISIQSTETQSDPNVQLFLPTLISNSQSSPNIPMQSQFVAGNAQIMPQATLNGQPIVPILIPNYLVGHPALYRPQDYAPTHIYENKYDVRTPGPEPELEIAVTPAASLDVKPETDSKPELDSMPEPEGKPESEAKPQLETKPEIEAKPEPELKPELESKPEFESNPEPENVANFEPERKPETEPPTEIKIEPQTNSKPENSVLETKPEIETKLESESQPSQEPEISKIHVAVIHEEDQIDQDFKTTTENPLTTLSSAKPIPTPPTTSFSSTSTEAPRTSTEENLKAEEEVEVETTTVRAQTQNRNSEDNPISKDINPENNELDA